MDKLIAELRKAGLTLEEIQDVLWLTLFQWQSTTTDSTNDQKNSSSRDPSYINDRKLLDLDKPASFQPLASPTPKGKPAPKAPLYSKRPKPFSQSSLSQESLPFSVPNAKAIRNSRELLRALRPLMQRVPSPSAWILDEEATAQYIAQTKLWLPQCKSKQEPWFELALVVESSPSMLIWQRHVVELRRLLIQAGTFRDVQTWSICDSHGQAYLCSKLGGAGINDQMPHSPEELIDLTGRRLILVVSDCISNLWQSQRLINALKVWSEHGPMALIQMLPEWLWDRTALSKVPKVRFHNLAPGIANRKLEVERRDRWRETTSKDIKVPILTLDPRITSAWSQMVAGKGNTRTPGLLFSDVHSTSVTEILTQNIDLPTEERVQRFRVFSSPIARRLTGLLAACPVINLPIIRIIQDAMLPESQQVHVAEVLFSGLFKLATSIKADTYPDDIEYKFDHEEIRRILLDSTPAPDTFRVLSEWIARNFGKRLDEFIAILLDPQSNPVLAERAKPFAEVSIEVLKCQGGTYARIAADLEQKLWLPQQPVEASWLTALPPLRRCEFKVANITIEIETLLGIDLQSFEFEVALIEVNQADQNSTDAPLEILTREIFSRTGKNLNDVEQLILEGTLANQTYEQIAASTTYSARHLKNSALKLWEVLSEVFGKKVTKRNLQNALAHRHLIIHRHRQQAQCFIENLGNGVQLEMVAIPGGSFLMGSPEDELERDELEGPQHTVTVQPFFLGKYPVTQAQWQAVAALPQMKRELKPDPSRFKGANRPVEVVSWYDAVEFCDRLSQYTGKLYRLPSEAEWEYACRAGTTTPFHFGETITSELANYDANYTYGVGVKGTYRKQTTPVGNFPANAFGLYDMHGNVWEWCLDHWHNNYEGAPTDGSAWLEENDNDNHLRLLRGGSWINYPGYCRSACRNRDDPGFDDLNLGFRVVCAGVAARTL